MSAFEPTCRYCDGVVLHTAPYGAPLDDEDTDLGDGYECPACDCWYTRESPFIVWQEFPSPMEVQRWAG